MSALTPPLEGQSYRHVPHIDESDSSNLPVGVTRLDATVADIADANVITSEVAATAGFPEHLRAHKLVIDLDVPATLVPSTTPGHSHLYIDHPMTWRTYLDVLRALARAGIVEEGYVGASEARGYTAVRLPWIRKGAPKPKPASPFADIFGGLL